MLDFLSTTRGKIIAGAISVVAFAAFITLIVWITANSWWPVVRDITLVALALLTFVPMIALTYAIIQITRTITHLRRDLEPILADVRETTKSVRETAKSASELTIKPTIRTASTLVGVKETFSTVFGQGKTGRRNAAERRRRMMEEQRAAHPDDNYTPDVVEPQAEADHATTR
jgi:hypothetical protein